jgi:hypothetical protein
MICQGVYSCVNCPREIDNEVIEDSNNAVSSGAVYSAIQAIPTGGGSVTIPPNLVSFNENLDYEEYGLLNITTTGNIQLYSSRKTTEIRFVVGDPTKAGSITVKIDPSGLYVNDPKVKTE